MIDLENLTKKFGDLTAVESITLHVEKGEVFGFLGPNGAGKTTTVRMLCCLISKTSGTARIGGCQERALRQRPASDNQLGKG
jgi:ABC-2 type transport system ATP-binding protein